MGYSEPTLKKLFALAGNECAFPGCENPVFDTTEGSLVGQICHIKGRSPGGPRYDPAQPDEERNGYENLLVKCAGHNKIVDDPQNVERYPVELLLAFKQAHESRWRNSIDKPDIVEQIVSRLQPTPPPTGLRCELSYHLNQKDDIAGLDFYVLEVTAHNDGDTTEQDVRASVSIPREHMEEGSSHSAEVHSPSNDRMFKYPPPSLRGIMTEISVDPGESVPLFSVSFTARKRHYLEGTQARITVRALAGNRLVWKKEIPVAEMLSPERMRYYQGQT